MNDDKKQEQINVHTLPSSGMQPIHRQYGLWISAAHAGGMTLPDSFDRCPLRRFNFYSLSQMYEGHGKLWLEDGTEREVHAGECIIITPGTLNRYGGYGGKSYCEDCVNFTGPAADMLKASGVITDGIFPMGEIRKLLPIVEYASDPAVNSQLKANIELQHLLVELHLNCNVFQQSRLPLMDELIEELRRNPEKWWSIRTMAEMCHIDVNIFRRLFRERTGLNPKIYIDRLKLQKAAEMLRVSQLPIGKIAEKFGYRDPYHFSRRFKAVIGLAPEHYRRQLKEGYQVGL